MQGLEVWVLGFRVELSSGALPAVPMPACWLGPATACSKPAWGASMNTCGPAPEPLQEQLVDAVVRPQPRCLPSAGLPCPDHPHALDGLG